MIPELPGMMKISEEKEREIQKAIYLFKKADITQIFRVALKKSFADWNLENEENKDKGCILKFSSDNEIMNIEIQFKKQEGTFINIISIAKNE